MIADMFDDEIRIGLSTGLEAYRAQLYFVGKPVVIFKETAPAGNEVLIIRPERRRTERGGAK